MIIDGSVLPDGSQREHDLCIVGTGVAGMVLAAELAPRFPSICMVESGAWKPDDAVQSLYALDSVGFPIRKNYQSRLRYFGGSCNIWAGRAMIYNEIDLRSRPWIEAVPWPMAFGELDSFYEIAARYLNLPNYDKLKPETWLPELSDFEAGLFDNPNFKANVSLFAKGPARFGYRTKYYRNLKRSDRIAVYINSNVVNVQLDDGLSRVVRLDVKCLNGRAFVVKAKRFVLACGGLENTRILLASDAQIPGGVGNQSGQLGRYYMDHPRAVFGRIKLNRKLKLDHLLGMPVRGGKMQLGVALSDRIQAEEGLLNNYLTLEPNYSIGSMELYQSFVKVMKRLLRKGYSGDRFDFKNKEIADVPEMIYLLTPKELLPHFMYYSYYKYSRFIKKFITKLSHVSLVSYSEQEAISDSRVYLGPDRDRLGMRKLVLDWKVSDRSLQSSLRLMELVDQHFRDKDAGRMEQDLTAIRQLPYTDASHHLGTTRMSDDPRSGVVDAHCRVHGIENLFIAGSSVFPTAGHANPTLTIAAMALRLADHLGSRGSEAR